jgi:hypothetical protein
LIRSKSFYTWYKIGRIDIILIKDGDGKRAMEDVGDLIRFFVERGFSLGIRGAYRNTVFNIRAVRDGVVLQKEDRELLRVLLDLRKDAELALKRKS